MRALLAAAILILTPPVDGPVTRPFEPPPTDYAPGHRGIDYAAPPGTPVLAAAEGTVAFAGPVAGARHVVVTHPGGWRTSYSFLAQVKARQGEAVRRGRVLGTSGGRGAAHEGGVVHFGVRRHGRYVDPAPYVGRLPLRVRLAPLDRSRPRACPSGSASPRSTAHAPGPAHPGSTPRRSSADGLGAASRPGRPLGSPGYTDAAPATPAGSSHARTPSVDRPRGPRGRRPNRRNEEHLSWQS